MGETPYPHAQRCVLDGHGHFAHKTDPVMVAAMIRSIHPVVDG